MTRGKYPDDIASGNPLLFGIPCLSLWRLLIQTESAGTRITASLQCLRKAALEERYPGSSNAKALEGTLLHDLLQV